MARRTSNTSCVVRTVDLRNLNADQKSLCDELSREAGRAWSEMVETHVRERDLGHWMWDGELKTQTKGGRFKLHANSIQALAERLVANVRTSLALIKKEKESGGPILTKLPFRPKEFQNVVWKGSGSPAFRKNGRSVALNNGRNQRPLVMTLPSEYESKNIVSIELDWKYDHYVLHLTIDTGFVNPTLLQGKRTAGMDMGEVNIAAVVAQDGDGIVISGRLLRSAKRLRNKRHADLDRLLQRSKNGSKRHKKLIAAKNRASGKLERQQRDVLHKAARKVADFCHEKQIAVLGIGDVRDIADGVNLGHKTNQKISQWPHGQFERYVREKTRVFGINCKHVDESYSTKTCSVCGAVRTSSPNGRSFLCSSRGVRFDRDVLACGTRMDRDGNGAANICSKTKHGEYGHVQLIKISYLMPLKVSAKSGRAVDIGRELVPVALVV